MICDVFVFGEFKNLIVFLMFFKLNVSRAFVSSRVFVLVAIRNSFLSVVLLICVCVLC